MKPLKFADRTRSVGKPEGWDEELDGPCETLDIYDHIDVQTGANIMFSLWRPDMSELQALLNGGAVRLGIFGVGHPVVNQAVVSQETCIASGEVVEVVEPPRI